MAGLDALPRRRLATLPTPIVALERLSAHLGGPAIWIKRDDLTGLALGGNKVRKLEFLIGEALARGCDTVLTGGAAQSNHCRQTAAAAAACGLECHLALGGEAPSRLEGNLLLDRLFGARLHWCGADRKGERLGEIAAALEAKGRRCYVVPYGGSDAVGARGFVAAVHELAAQSPRFSHVVFASSSGGTQAGLIVGRASAGLDLRLIGIRIDKEDRGPRTYVEEVLELAQRTASEAALDLRIGADEIEVDERFCELGYGEAGPDEREAIRMAARLEGLLLDPVYTARAMAGLVTLVREGAFSPIDRILFWHTGGIPALFTGASERWLD